MRELSALQSSVSFHQTYWRYPLSCRKERRQDSTLASQSHMILLVITEKQETGLYSCSQLE